MRPAWNGLQRLRDSLPHLPRVGAEAPAEHQFCLSPNDGDSYWIDSRVAGIPEQNSSVGGLNDDQVERHLPGALPGYLLTLLLPHADNLCRQVSEQGREVGGLLASLLVGTMCRQGVEELSRQANSRWQVAQALPQT